MHRKVCRYESFIRKCFFARGRALPKDEAGVDCQGLALWERWHGVSRDGEGEPANPRSD